MVVLVVSGATRERFAIGGFRPLGDDSQQDGAELPTLPDFVKPCCRWLKLANDTRANIT
jgi:hypothetical protein